MEKEAEESVIKCIYYVINAECKNLMLDKIKWGRRLAIIKCCGREKCSDAFAKVRTNATTIETSTEV